MTRRERIVSEIKSALQNITVLNGYNTDAGRFVEIEQDSISDSITYLINIFEGDDDIIDETIGSAFINMPLTIECYATAKTGSSERYSVKHKLISDVKKSLMAYRAVRSREISNITYPAVQRIEKENGSIFVVASIVVNIEYHEKPGNPEY